ncbi:MAG: peptide-N-glycosidase F-related protein [Myxococcota bacterium]
MSTSRTMPRFHAGLVLGLFFLSACGGSDAPADGGTDAAVPADEGLADAGPPRGPGCTHAGYDETPFDGSASTPSFGELAPNFEVRTLGEGTFRLSSIWGDCSMLTLVPLPDPPALGEIETVVDESAPNTHFLFFSRGTDPAGDVSAVRERIHARIDALPADGRERELARFHFATTPATANRLLNYLGSVDTQYAIIDSRQRLRDAGSYNTFTGRFEPQVAMTRFAGHWYNYERRLEERLAREDADPDVLVVPWVTEGWEQTDEGRLPLMLPTAAEMARFDRVEIVLKETCGEGARFPVHFGFCPAWDVGHKITLCEDEATCTSDERRQLFRHVTGYHSGGWWTEDVSHGLPFFREGGQQWMRTNRRDFVGTIELRFYDDGDVAPEAHVAFADHLVGLGTAPWDPTHNDSFGGYSFTPPPGTVRVVLDARVQGGGNNAPSGCAEFCSTTHTAAINGTTFSHTFEMESDRNACARRAGEGVVAGQFGTWQLDRGSWCPGGPVERWQEDITGAVNLEGANTIEWTGSYAGDPWPPGGGLTSTVWLLFYGADGEALITPDALPTCPAPPRVTIRDFSRSDPDFQPVQDAYQALEDGDPVKEMARGNLRGVLAPDLVLRDGEWKPVLAWPEGALPYTTAESFDRWWTDGPGRNTTTPAANTFRRTRQDTFAFFASNGPQYAAKPLVAGDFGYGAEELSFNFEGVPTPMNTALTVEIAGSFVHEAGRRLRYGSTADLWVFVNHRLAWESGGYLNKGFQRSVLELDELGLSVGETYDLHVFAVINRGSRGNPHVWLEHPACL